MKYTVKQLADKMEISEHTLRYYTDMGLLPCGRDKNNRRVFDQESVNWVEGIKCLRSCGMSIEAIKEYSDLCMEKETEGDHLPPAAKGSPPAARPSAGNR